MAKRIGILTFHFVENYGAVLQAYALRKFLEGLGHDVEFLDYRPAHVVGGGTLTLKRPLSNLPRLAAAIFFDLRKLRSRALRNRDQSRLFGAFMERNLPVGPRTYYTHAQLCAYPPRYDTYVCGSDQIWNSSRQHGIDEAYFLGFGDSVHRVSYAASFGRAALPPEDHEIISNHLRRFSSISVREPSGVSIVRNLIGKEPFCAPDPTLLLQDYNPVIRSTPTASPFIFLYGLRSSDPIKVIHQEVCNTLRLPTIMPFNSCTRGTVPGEALACGPSEWLGLIKNSEFVVTNSFHGTVFSILFRKPFVSVGLTGKRAPFNDRAESLLKRLGLENRFVANVEAANIASLCRETIDWDNVFSKLLLWRNDAEEYLRTSLGS